MTLKAGIIAGFGFMAITDIEKSRNNSSTLKAMGSAAREIVSVEVPKIVEKARAFKNAIAMKL